MERLKIIITAVVIFGVVPVALLALIWHGRCAKSTAAAALSPDGAFEAQTVKTNCGQSMKIATEVMLVRKASGTKADEKSVLLYAGKGPLPVHWDGAHRLVIPLPRGAEVVERLWTYEGVKIDILPSGPNANPPPRPGDSLGRPG